MGDDRRGGAHDVREGKKKRWGPLGWAGPGKKKGERAARQGLKAFLFFPFLLLTPN